MFKVPLPELKEKIDATGKVSAEELDNQIKEKINELSGLISEEGAAHIIANELNVELVPKGGGKLKIKEIYAGMKNVSAVGKVVRKYDVREFAKGDGTGKVCSLILGDETGTIRVVFWNEQVEQLKDLKENDILQIEEAYVRENNNAREIHMGQRGTIDINPDGVTVGDVREKTEYERKNIAALQGGEMGVELLGTVVQVFDPRFFNVDKDSGKRVQEGGVLSYVMNLVVDDGTGNIRTVFWKNQTNNLLSKKEEDMAAYHADPQLFESIKTDLLGEQFKLLGKVVKNDMFNRLEFSVQVVLKANAEEELAKLEEKVE